MNPSTHRGDRQNIQQGWQEEVRQQEARREEARQEGAWQGNHQGNRQDARQNNQQNARWESREEAKTPAKALEAEPGIQFTHAGKSFVVSVVKVLLALLCLVLATAAGRIQIPGNPVPITLQTAVLMCMALTLSLPQITAAVASYIALGLAGFPVFSGFISAAALVGPTAGYIWGFLVATLVTAVIAGATRSRSAVDVAAAASARRFDGGLRNVIGIGSGRRGSRISRQVFSRVLTLSRFALACFVGLMLTQYTMGILMQAFLTHVSVSSLIMVSLPFLAADSIKVVFALIFSLTCMKFVESTDAPSEKGE